MPRGTNSSGSPAIGNLYGAPRHIPVAMTFDRITVRVSTSGSGGLVRAGIYTDNNGYPGTLIRDLGTIDGSTTGGKTVTLGTPLTLQPGLYWMVNLTLTATVGMDGSAALLVGALSNGFVGGAASYIATGTHTDLPSNWPGVSDTWTRAPMIGLWRSA